MPQEPLEPETATADVYAGDVAASGTAAAAAFSFELEADAEPGAFARIVNVLTLTNTAPSQVTMQRLENGTLSVHIELTGITAGMANSLRGKLAQLTDVTAVTMKALGAA